MLGRLQASTTLLWQFERLAPIVLLVAALSGFLSTSVLYSQQQPQSGLVQLNIGGPTPLPTLVEYVSKRTGTRFMYDDSLAQKQINLQVPDEIPVESLMDVLQSALLINQLAIAPTDAPGWYRIVASAQIPSVSQPSSSIDISGNANSAVPVTQVFSLKRADPIQIRTLIQPFLSTTAANVIPVASNRTLIVTDVSSNIRRVARLIEILDAEQVASSIRLIKAKHVGANELAEKLRTILEAKARTTGIPAAQGNDAQSSSVTSVEVAVDERLNQLILIGIPSQIDAAVEILNLLDVPLSTMSATYRPQYLSPQQLDTILRSWLDTMSPRPTYDSRIEGAVLSVNTTESTKSQIDRLVAQLDSRETSNQQSPIRFYKIKNVPVQDILDTLNTLQGGYGLNPFGGQGNSNTRQRSRTTNDQAVPGQNNPFLVNGATAQPGLIPPNPPSLRNGITGVNSNNSQSLVDGFAANGNPSSQTNSLFSNGAYGFGMGQAGIYSGGLPYYPGGVPFERGIQSPLGNALVTADVGSNTLIIIAEPQVQQAYEQLIEFLDKRRPQVMIEARIVIIDTSDNYTLGVEVSGGDRTGSKRLFAFSSYGLSTVNPTTGALTINPGQGFNATLVDPTTADVVVRALTTHRRARVLSSPKILVDDNAEGTLTSVNEVPFTSVNASQTVATTSFAGFAEAGTTITVTPTISEERHVNLEYIVTLNSFTGTGSAGVPPPRQTNEVSSRVTVPDTYTIIVGGLSQKNASQTLNGIPYLEKIPIIKELSSLTTNNFSESTLFVFLRPVIVDDDKFRDLLYLSKVDARRAGDGHNYPASSPLLMTE